MQTKLCPQCQSPIPADAPGGLCPACILLGVAVPTNLSQAAAASAPTIEEIAAAFPELEILDILGQGGMGIVFKARQPRLDRLVALKILPPALAAQPGFSDRFTREARVLARLAHPNIVAIYDFGESAGFFYLIMEFVNGVNLRAAMQAGVKPEQALLLVPRICEALQFAHDHGVLHRDIKPENILLDTRGTPKLADFGIAKLAGEESAITGLTATGAALGTAAYMAPEQVEKPATVDHRADIYSLGVVLYEMLTGELPLGRFGVPSEKSSVNRGVDEVVMRALEKERERRQQSATAMKTEVERATQGSAQPVIAAASPAEEDPLVTKILGALCALSAVGIPITGMLHTSTPSPRHMVAFTILFGVLSGLSGLFAPASTATPARTPKKDIGFAYLFWFLFGVVGGHKFYLRQYGWGWLYFFTCGLFLVGWLIDLFTLPAQVRRFNEELHGTPSVASRESPDNVPNRWPRRVFLLLVLIGLGLALSKLANRSPEHPAPATNTSQASVDVHYSQADPKSPGIHKLTLNSRTPYGWVADFSFRIRDEKGERELPYASFVVAQQPPSQPHAAPELNAEISWEFNTRDMLDGHFQLNAKLNKGSTGNAGGSTSDATAFHWEPSLGRSEWSRTLVTEAPSQIFFLRGLPSDSSKPEAEMFILVKARPMNPREKAEGFQGFLGPDRFEKLIPLSDRQDEAIQRAAQQLDETRERIKAGVPTTKSLESAELDLAIAEARGDESKIAAARRREKARNPEISRLQDENIRTARERLVTTKQRVDVGVATPLELAAAERNLAIAEAREDELKVATALLTYAEIHYKTMKAATEQGTATTTEALDAEQELNTARIRVEKARDQTDMARDAAALEKPANP